MFFSIIPSELTHPTAPTSQSLIAFTHNTNKSFKIIITLMLD